MERSKNEPKGRAGHPSGNPNPNPNPNPSPNPSVEDREGQAEALRSGAAGAGVVRPVPVPVPPVAEVTEVTEVHPDADDGLDKTGGRVTTIRQLTFTGTYPSIGAALDAVKGKAMGFREAYPDLRIETANQADGQVALSALMTFTIVVDD